MKELRFTADQNRVLEDLYLAMKIADPHIKGRASMNALTRAFDAFDPHVAVEEMPGSIMVAAKPHEDEVVIHLEDADFDVVKSCARLVCEEGVNGGTVATQQTARIFNARRALAVLDFLDAAKPPVKPEA